MKGIERLRAQVAADPEASAQWDKAGRELRPLELQAMAWIEGVFPPDSPSSKARGGRKTALSPQLKNAVCNILDAKMGFEICKDDFEVAMKSGDPDFFRIMAQAAEYVRNMPGEVSTFAACVIAARRIAAGVMAAGGPLPSRGTVIDAVIKRLGRAAFPKDEKTRWSEVMKAARLSDLKREGSARTGVAGASGRRRRP